MKKHLFFSAFLTLATLFTTAAPVDTTNALQVAQNFFSKNVVAMDDRSTMFPLVCVPNSGFRNCYLFNASTGNGFVIVSADDRALPILGYSETGTLNPATLPINFVSWMDVYESEIDRVKENVSQPDETTASQWQQLLGNTYEPMRADRSVAPLLSTTWGQNAPYNAYCPYDNTYGAQCVTGCVATAMAQIMKYWEYPYKGTGSHSYYHNNYGTLSANFGSSIYSWFDMPNSNPPANNTSIAALMYHCGVSVDMNYGTNTVGGSSAYSSSIPNALINYFGYQSTAMWVQETNYGYSQWIALLKNELDNGRPMEYSGQDLQQGGHSFVCDGYNNDYFHFNWGWSGTANGYYMLTSLAPSSYDFSNGEAATIGIQPPSDFTGYNLLTYSNMNLSASTVPANQNFTLTMNVVNMGSRVYDGEFVLVAMDVNDNNNYYYACTRAVQLNGGTYTTLNFNTASIPVAGNYYLWVFYDVDGYLYYVQQYSTYVNEANITVTGSGMDNYESNNTPGTAYQLGSVTSSSRTYTVNASFHNASDVDYYKVVCPAGYYYTVNATLYSRYTSYNFTADAQFYSTTNTNSWGTAYDETMPAMALNNGGTVYFKVVPYNGSLGTYRLQITVTRSSVGIEEADSTDDLLTLYPNPTASKCMVQCNLAEAATIRLYDAQGRLLRQIPMRDELTEIDLSNCASGIYFVYICTEDRILAIRKIVRE
ncbi:MAG: thiol protease/hemagglutinin PrtT [Bacteroidales bacterium]|nr:thiol protease/hemagglutinin PrtT [Bacteroidales bacterium]MBR0055626.1 thiol protease/hemagglutinin PrtT [Bacteroidales bacterium]